MNKDLIDSIDNAVKCALTDGIWCEEDEKRIADIFVKAKAELERTAAFDELLAACQMEIAFRDWMSGRLSEEKFSEMITTHGWKEPKIECDFTHDFMVAAIQKATGQPRENSGETS